MNDIEIIAKAGRIVSQNTNELENFYVLSLYEATMIIFLFIVFYFVINRVRENRFKKEQLAKSLNIDSKFIQIDVDVIDDYQIINYFKQTYNIKNDNLEPDIIKLLTGYLTQLELEFEEAVVLRESVERNIVDRWSILDVIHRTGRLMMKASSEIKIASKLLHNSEEIKDIKEKYTDIERSVTGICLKLITECPNI